MRRLVVLGAGGIGTAVGTILCSAGNDVTLVTHSATDSEHIRRHGARVVGVLELSTRPHSTSDLLPLGSDDVLLVAVKAHQTEDALKRVHGVPAVALSLQNGIEKEQPLIERFGRRQVVASVVQVTAALEAPGVARCSAIEPSAMSAAEPDSAAAAVELASIFSRSGMPTTVVDNAEQIEWTKAAQWLPSSLLTAATGMSLDRVLSDDRLARVYVTIARECAAVARAHGVELVSFGRLYAAEVTEGPTTGAVAKLERLGVAMSAGGLAGYRTSMELDLAKHRPLELDSTLGAMERAARAVNVECPALEAAGAIVRARGDAASSRAEVGA